MTKSQLVDSVQTRTGLTRKQSADAVEAVLETVQDVLGRGGEVALRALASSASPSAARARASIRAPASRWRSPPRACRSSRPASSLKQAVRA